MASLKTAGWRPLLVGLIYFSESPSKAERINERAEVPGPAGKAPKWSAPRMFSESGSAALDSVRINNLRAFIVIVPNSFLLLL